MQNFKIGSRSFRASLGLMMVLAAGASACTASIAQTPRRAPSGMDLAQAWPSAGTQRGLEPYGAPQHVARLQAPVDISEFVTPKPAADSAAKPIPKRASAQASARVIEPATPAPQVEASPVPKTIVASSDASADADRYAARDRDAKKQKQFRGGDTLVITSGAVLLALLILLLVLLLT